MNRYAIVSVLTLSSALGGCSAAAKKTAAEKPAPIAPEAKPRPITMVQPARFVVVESVGALLDEAQESSVLHARTPVLINGRRLILQDGALMETADSPETLAGFRSLPARLGGGYVVWSDEHTYHTPTFLGKLTPFVKMSARGGVRPWFDSFVLRTNIGALEVNPKSFTVRRTELARFSEMISGDGQVGIRTDSVGRMEASVDGGKTFRTLGANELGNYTGPTLGPDQKLVFRREMGERRPGTITPEMLTLDASGKLVPFEPKANENLVLSPQSWAADREDGTQAPILPPPDLRLAVVAGALVPGEQALFLQELNLRVLSAKTGLLINNIPLNLGVPDFGNCQPITIGDDVFLACTHAAGAHLFSLRGTPTTVQLEATFPEPGEFVGGLGKRFLFAGRCGSTPPTVRDFRGYARSDTEGASGDADPNAGSIDLPTLPDEPEKKPTDDIFVCVRLADGAWIERRIEGLPDRKQARFVPGDNGNVTVVYFDKPSGDEPTNATPPKASEGVRFLRVDSKATKLGLREFIQPIEAADRPLRLVDRNVWLDEKDGSVHGWIIAPPKAKTSNEKDSQEDGENAETEETDEASAEPSEDADDGEGEIEWYKQKKFVGVQINSDGSVVKHPLPRDVDLVVVGGPYALARDDQYLGERYFESTDGGRTYQPVAGPIASNLVEGIGGEVEGCSILGCALRGGLVRLGWGSATNPDALKTNAASKSDDHDPLTSKVFDPKKLLPSKPSRSLVCRLNAKEAKEEGAETRANEPLPVTVPMLRNLELGATVDRKWSTLATSPFELKPAHRVAFEDVNADSIQGTPIPILRSTAANPVGLFLRSNEFRFDLAPGAKRKPVRLASDARGDVAAEIDRDSFVLFDPRVGDIQLVKGSAVRPLMRIVQVPDVYYSSLVLARRVGVGIEGLGVLLWQSGSGDMLLGDLDLGRGSLGPLRFVGNYEERVVSTSCPSSEQDYRVVLNEHIHVNFEPLDEGRSGLRAASLVRIGPKGICVEASEIHLADETTVVVRYSGSDSAGHPAMLHKRGKSLPATCTYE